MKPHKHAKLIKAWADGAIIQVQAMDLSWVDCRENNPPWYESEKYRIKPKPTIKVYQYLYYWPKEKNWILTFHYYKSIQEAEAFVRDSHAFRDKISGLKPLLESEKEIEDNL